MGNIFRFGGGVDAVETVRLWKNAFDLLLTFLMVKA